MEGGTMTQRSFVLGVLWLGLFGLLPDRLWAAEVKTQDLTFMAGKDEVTGFLAEPEGKGPFPAVVVIRLGCHPVFPSDHQSTSQTTILPLSPPAAASIPSGLKVTERRRPMSQ
jgi:hypothetical protein